MFIFQTVILSVRGMYVEKNTYIKSTRTASPDMLTHFSWIQVDCVVWSTPGAISQTLHQHFGWLCCHPVEDGQISLSWLGSRGICRINKHVFLIYFLFFFYDPKYFLLSKISTCYQFTETKEAAKNPHWTQIVCLHGKALRRDCVMPKMNHWRCFADIIQIDVRWVDTTGLARHSIRFACEFLRLGKPLQAFTCNLEDWGGWLSWASLRDAANLYLYLLHINM